MATLSITSPRLRQPRSTRTRMLGQAMIEYIVVLAFGVILLIQADATGSSPVQKLATAIKDYHRHYTYGMSIATIPDCEAAFSYDFNPTGDYTFTLSGSVDKCPDWTDPQFPIPSLSLTDPLSFGESIGTIIKDTINGFINDFANPGNLLKDIFSFDIGSFF